MGSNKVCSVIRRGTVVHCSSSSGIRGVRNVYVLSARLLLVFLVILLFVDLTGADDKSCYLLNSYCICKMSDGSGYIDLTSLRDNPNDPFADIDGEFKYFYNPCYPFKKDDENCKDVIACQLDSSSGFMYHDLGIPASLKTWYDNTNNRVVFNYTSKDVTNERITSVSLECDPTVTGEAQFTAWESSTKRTYLFNLKHKCACAGLCGGSPGSSSLGLSAGSVILIIFTVFLCIYFIVGIAYRKVIMNATGMELVPNLEFWRDLPNVAKDGCCFIRGKFDSGPKYEQI